MKTNFTALLYFLPLALAHAAELESFSSAEFRVIATMPKEVLSSKAQQANGTLGSFKAFDAENSAFYMLSVFQVTEFMQEPANSKLDWSKLLSTHFKSWSGGHKPQPNTVVETPGKWNENPAIRFSYTTAGFVGDGVTAYHRGMTTIRGGVYYSLSVVSLESDASASKAATRLEESFMVLDSLMKKAK